MKLYEVIRDLRDEKGLTQEKLASDSDLTRGYISRLEQGTYPDESPSIRTLRKLADGLGESLELILSRAGITQADYIQSATPRTFFRARYNLNEHQTQAVEAFIKTLKKQYKS